jgi:3-deoxy-D-manno-octulosonic-acid transferase
VRTIAAVGAQSPTCAQRFVGLGVPRDRVHDVGSVKFDGAITDRANPRTLQLASLANIRHDEIVFLAGSTQSPEESYALRSYARLKKEFSNLRLILVPRHPERFDEVAQLLDKSGLRWVRRSELRANAPVADILLVDVVGELGAWWGRADIGFVGGSMGKRGGQNMIEPAAFGVAICFGPNTKNFRDVVRLLLDREAAVVITGEQEMAEFVRACTVDPGYRLGLGKRAVETVLDQTGAADRTITILTSLLDNVAFPSTYGAADSNPTGSPLRRSA